MKISEIYSELFSGTEDRDKQKANFEDCRPCRKEFCQSGGYKFC